MLKLVWQYIRFYKKQTLAILMSVFLTSMLISGIGTLMYSSEISNLENKREIYGDWHYSVAVDENTFEAVKKDKSDKDGKKSGFDIESVGKVEIRDYLMTPYRICFMEADKNYLRMVHRELKEGVYPKGENEIAADWYTLGNLGFSGNLGDELKLNGREFVLTGIVNSSWSPSTDKMEIFVGEDFIGCGSQTLMYIKFNEAEKLYKQRDAFQWRFKINSEYITANEEVTELLGGEKPEKITDIIKFGLTSEYGNITYIILTLQKEYDISFYAIILLLCIFSVMVIHSIFMISIAQRKSEYGIMQTLGISEKRIAGILVCELWLLFLVGFPAGVIAGNGILRIWYKHFTSVSNIYVSRRAVVIGFIFLIVSLSFVGLITVREMRKMTINQLVNRFSSADFRIRRIYSRRKTDLLSIVNRKFMFSGRRRVLGILLSLSIGGSLFLCSTYLIENLKIHAEMSMKSDDGLNSAYKISLMSNDLADTIASSVVSELKDLDELKNVYGTKFTLGEITIDKSELEWPEFFNEQNKNAYYRERFGGILVDNGDDTYSIKYDVYGYDNEEIEHLQDYVLEGEIDADALSAGKIILVALMDGQGNYSAYGKHPGDTITLSSLDKKEKKEFEIAAIVSRALSQESGFLNQGSWHNMQSVIMTNEAMEREYGISDYSFINASLAEGADEDKAAKSILNVINDIPKAVLHDYTDEIETQKKYLNQKQRVLTGVSIILLAISLFHIMNSMNYTIMSRKREYGIMRAIGITDRDYYVTILKMGVLYGVLADLFIFLIYNLLLRRFMDYYMAHVVKFLHFTATVPGVRLIGIMLLNIAVAVIAVYIPARKIIGENVYNQI
jgi:ABC-type antimicrobial peptide transport system permease subunit